MKTGLTLVQIADIISGKWVNKAEDVSITGFSTDSRLIQPGELFIALRGTKFDGNDFYREALTKGAGGVVVSKLKDSDRDLSGNILLVVDTVRAIQQISSIYRRQFVVKTTGITGSTGKTIVKDMVANILAREFRIWATPLSFHGQIGLPLTLFGLKPEHEILVLELGISRRGEMSKLADIAHLDIGLITNISEAHLEHLGTLEEVAREKSYIFENFNEDHHHAILNYDDPHCREISQKLKCVLVTFGLSEEADYQASKIEPAGKKGYWFTLKHPQGRTRMYVNAPGKHNIYNALAAIACARALGASYPAIKAGLDEFHLPQMRLEIHTSSVLEESVTIINDTYNASPASMRGALVALREMAGQNRTIAILGDMLELGNFAATAHEKIGEEIQSHGIDLLFTIGSLARHIGLKAVDQGMPRTAVDHCQDLVEAAEKLRMTIKEGDYLLFKGSRILQLDRLAAQFIGGIRPTKLIIDLEAIAHNVRQIRELVGYGPKIMAVVKSGGYGHDSRKVAQVVLENGADYLAVAVPDEGVFLRKTGFTTTPILVMGPTLPEEAMKLVKYQLAQAVHSLAIVSEIDKEAKKKKCSIPIHIKIDTGMGRMGIQGSEVEEFIAACAQFSNVFIEGLMTHLSSADDPTSTAFTRHQIKTFQQIVDTLNLKNRDIPLIHAAASAGILSFPEAWFTMIRPGIMIYGLYPSPAYRTKINLKPAASFVTKLAHIKEVPPETPISYSRSYITTRQSRIATLPVGYYDGYNRLLSNKAHVLIRGKRAPIVGNITMDMTMVDITHIPEARVGDEVVLFGRQLDQEIELEEHAHLCGTINYELIGNISARVSRVYRDG